MAGTYIAVRVHPESERVIREFMERHKIPIVYPNLERRRHVTLVSTDDDFSKEFVPEFDRRYFAVPDKFEIFPTREGNRCLVLRIICPQLIERHRRILADWNATDRFPEYKTHISLSYDIGDMAIDRLPSFPAPLILGEEYCEEFNENWVRK